MVEIINEEDFIPFISKIDEELRILNGLISAYERRTDLK